MKICKQCDGHGTETWPTHEGDENCRWCDGKGVIEERDNDKTITIPPHLVLAHKNGNKTLQ